ncbi:tetratricopeptide repeat protein [Streptomyces sp. NPDC059828]|uniref:tetratricopeptide repeat protein n=1 Tax=Streptomyces sp. NPDC059828 TaxID=3346965 RepID=UPI00364A4A6F
MTTPHPTVERAQALIDFDRHDQARDLLARHLAEEPGDVRAWVKIGYCHLNTQEAQQARDAAAEALALDPEDYGALILRAEALTRGPGSSWRDVEPLLREAVRINPHHWYGYAMLADAVWRMAMVRYTQASGTRAVGHDEFELVTREAAGIAAEALRLGPDEVYAHEVAKLIAEFSGRAVAADQHERAILRVDPAHTGALVSQTRKAAGAPGVNAARAADLYATGLASAPDSAELQRGLDEATYRMLRGMRWLALLCVGLAGAMLDLWVADGEVPKELPVSLGQRLWYLVPTSAIWVLGALLRYRRRRMGVRLNVRSLIGRFRWARIAVAQAAWAMLCALLITQVPWSERTLPQVLFWAGLAPTLATMWFDRPRTT